MKNRKKILEVNDLTISFKTQQGVLKAIRGVDFDLYRGETLAIVGESGSGKSVTSKAIMGILAGNSIHEKGSIMYEGEDLMLLPDEKFTDIRGDKISMIFQDPMSSLNPIMKVGKQITETLILKLKMPKEKAYQKAIDLMREVGIPEPEKRFHQYPFQFSGGMRQRIVIAIALANDAEILICDEPTTALDVTIQAQILELIKRLKEERGLTVIFITHDLGVVANIADRVVVMYAGQIVEEGLVEEIFYDSRHPYTWALLSSMPNVDTKEDRLESIPGIPPNAIDEIIGDAFAPRNRYAMKIDFEQEPPKFQVTETHYAKTWLLHPDAPKVEKPEAVKRVEANKGKVGLR